jgi:hypothetical protein
VTRSQIAPDLQTDRAASAKNARHFGALHAARLANAERSVNDRVAMAGR